MVRGGRCSDNLIVYIQAIRRVTKLTADTKASVESLLGLDKWDWERTSHIEITDQNLCANCKLKPCLKVCPARVYTKEGAKIAFNYEACLELRACYIACHEYGNGAIKWRYPAGGKGISYRFG